jgi:hypothetical protein
VERPDDVRARQRRDFFAMIRNRDLMLVKFAPVFEVGLPLFFLEAIFGDSPILGAFNWIPDVIGFIADAFRFGPPEAVAAMAERFDFTAFCAFVAPSESPVFAAVQRLNRAERDFVIQAACAAIAGLVSAREDVVRPLHEAGFFELLLAQFDADADFGPSFRAKQEAAHLWALAVLAMPASVLDPLISPQLIEVLASWNVEPHDPRALAHGEQVLHRAVDRIMEMLPGPSELHELLIKSITGFRQSKRRLTSQAIDPLLFDMEGSYLNEMSCRQGVSDREGLRAPGFYELIQIHRIFRSQQFGGAKIREVAILTLVMIQNRNVAAYRCSVETRPRYTYLSTAH